MKAVPRVMLPEATDPPPLTLDVTHVDAEVVGVTMAGDVDAGAAEQLRAFMVAAVDRHLPRSIVVDCSGVSFLDAAGVGALVRAHEHATARLVALRLVNPSRTVTRVLTVAGLAGVLGLEPS
jgi:anti-sigma B factor antagonist